MKGSGAALRTYRRGSLISSICRSSLRRSAGEISSMFPAKLAPSGAAVFSLAWPMEDDTPSFDRSSRHRVRPFPGGWNANGACRNVRPFSLIVARVFAYERPDLRICFSSHTVPMAGGRHRPPVLRPRTVTGRHRLARRSRTAIFRLRVARLRGTEAAEPIPEAPWNGSHACTARGSSTRLM